MKDVNLYIKENVRDLAKDVYVAPDIPEKKLNNVIKAYGCEDFYESILAVYDDTIFGSAKDGIVFTGEKLLHNNNELTEYIYKDIESVNYIKDVKVNDKGKENISEYVLIKSSSGIENKFEVTLAGSFNYEKFAIFLNTIIKDFDYYKEEDQLKELANMPDELKIAYIKIIINMTYADDEKIDEKELSEIYMLMTRLVLSNESRFVLRSYITEIENNNMDFIEELLEIIKVNSEASHYKSLMISLVKDLINVHFSTKDTIERDFKFLDNNKKLFDLSQDEIKLAYDTIEHDYKILKEDLDDDAIGRAAKELAAQALAAGAPLASVYISGSVAGMSAAGITSGLATLGMSMGMTGGLAVIGIIGVLSYKSVKHLTGANELDRYRARELLLQNVIMQTQKTMSFIINDINYIVQKLNYLIVNHSEQMEKIKKLSQVMLQLQGTLKNIDTKSDQYKNSVNRLKNPKILDHERLQSLTTDATNKKLYDYIIKNYERHLNNIDDNEIEEFTLKDSIETEVLDNMANIFEKLGYFDISKITKSKVSGFIKKISR